MTNSRREEIKLELERLEQWYRNSKMIVMHHKLRYKEAQRECLKEKLKIKLLREELEEIGKQDES